MEENKIKETIEELERNIRSINQDINQTENIIEIPKLRDRVRVLQNARDIAVELQETIRGASNPSKDIFILKGNNELKMEFFVDKLVEEVDEVINALLKKDMKNFVEEVFDVLQVAIDLLAKLEMNEPDMKKAIEMHNAKIKSRGFEFEYPAISFNMME